jgi:hypothetical protein
VYVTNDPSWKVEDWKKLVGSVVDVEQINPAIQRSKPMLSFKQ